MRSWLYQQKPSLVVLFQIISINLPPPPTVSYRILFRTEQEVPPSLLVETWDYDSFLLSFWNFGIRGPQWSLHRNIIATMLHLSHRINWVLTGLNRSSFCWLSFVVEFQMHVCCLWGCHSGTDFGYRSSRHQGVSPPRNHLANNQLATKRSHLATKH